MTAPSEDLAKLARPGEVLMGKYRVERVLGVGGMGAVVEARHLQLDDRVAIKFLLASMGQNEEIVARFLREGRAAAKIRNEHVVRVFDVGTLENGAPYMVMEFLQGKDLSQMLEQHGRMPIAQAIDWLLEACEAIAEAHAAGIVHRDLKPANLFVHEKSDGSHTIKVLDFGISKINETADGQSFGMTKTQAVMGSPRYMSPEQMRSSRNVDARSDIWALGTVLHELLSGAPPFDAETMPELCARILADPPPPLRNVRQDLPPGLEEALSGALQKDVAMRYQNVAQFAAALAPFGSPAAAASAQRAARALRLVPSQSDPNARLSAIPSMVPAPPMPAATANAWAGSQPGMHPPPPKRSSALGWIVGGAAALLLVGAIAIGGIVVATRGSAPASASAAAIATATASPSESAAPSASAATSATSAPTASATTTTSATASASATSAATPPAPTTPPTAVRPPTPTPPTPVPTPKPKPTSNPFDDR